MKRTICLSFIAAFFVATLSANTLILKVGDYETYYYPEDAWQAAIDDSNYSEYIIDLEPGYYVLTASLKNPSGKKITISGSGADNTFIGRAYPGTFTLESGESPGRLMQINAAGDSNSEVTFENLTLQTIGFSGEDSNGGGVVNINVAGNVKITMRNCNLNNIFGRTGAIMQIQGSAAGNSLLMENCFVEACGAFDFNSFEGILAIRNGALTIKDCTFFNNEARYFATTGSDRNLKIGYIISMSSNASSCSLENCIFYNNGFKGSSTISHPLVSVKVGTTTIKDVIFVKNKRLSTLDCDLYYTTSTAPSVSDSYFSAIRSIKSGADYHVTEMTGATIDSTLTYTSPEINYEMDGELPKIFTDVNGVKYIRKAADSNLSTVTPERNFAAWGVKGELQIEAPEPVTIKIYNLLGAEIFNRTSVTQEKIALPKGVYIVKSGSGSVKVCVK